jgi:photosystem II stability/assembly factor-like uncharacterized protein
VSERRDDDLAAALPGYLAGYATYRRSEPRSQSERPAGAAAPHRRLLTAVVACVAAVVIAIPVGITLLLRLGVNSPAGALSGPQYVGDLDMFSETTGWAWGGGGEILHTNVGVQQWTEVPPPIGQFHVIEVAWVDAQSARLLVASGPDGQVGTYPMVGWSTDDGGVTWTQGQPFTALDETAMDLYSFTDLHFVDRTHGWFFDTQDETVGSPILIFRTVDGGMHWSQVETTPSRGTATPGALPTTCAKSGLTFLDATTGWVTGYCVGGGPFFDVTHDGGTTWTAQPFDCPIGCTLSPPQFTSSLDGVLEGATGVAVLYATTDGGRTWSPRADPPASFVDFINADDGFSLGLSGNNNPDAVIWTTRNGGKSWQEVPRSGGGGAAGPTSDIDAIDFVNTNLGWATPVDISTGGLNYIPTPNTAPFTLWETRDAGATWTVITPRFIRASMPETGVVRGTLDAAGGIAPGLPRPIPGTVTLRASDGTPFTATVGSDGAFSIRLPVGTYTATGSSPSIGGGASVCQALAPVHLTPGADITTMVVCQVK